MRTAKYCISLHAQEDVDSPLRYGTEGPVLMHLGIDRLLEAIGMSFTGRHKLSVEDRRKAVDNLAEFGSAHVEDQIQWCELGSCQAACFEPANAVSSSAVLYLHGGAFVAGSPVSHQYLTRQLANQSGMTVYSLNYRLAPENRFPSALDDVIAAYRALVGIGRFTSIALAGDSAGATLATLAACKLRDGQAKMPCALGLISPLLDLRCVDPFYDKNKHSDPIISRASLTLDVAAFLGDHDAASPEVSPLFADLQGLPSIHIQVSECETLVGDSLKFEEKAKQAGVDVSLSLYPGMIHVWHLYSKYVREADDAIRELGCFLQLKCGDDTGRQ